MEKDKSVSVVEMAGANQTAIRAQDQGRDRLLLLGVARPEFHEAEFDPRLRGDRLLLQRTLKGRVGP